MDETMIGSRDGYRVVERLTHANGEWRNFLVERTKRRGTGRSRWYIGFNGERFAVNECRSHLERTRPKVAEWAFDLIAKS